MLPLGYLVPYAVRDARDGSGAFLKSVFFF